MKKIAISTLLVSAVALTLNSINVAPIEQDFGLKTISAKTLILNNLMNWQRMFRQAVVDLRFYRIFAVRQCLNTIPMPRVLL